MNKGALAAALMLAATTNIPGALDLFDVKQSDPKPKQTPDEAFAALDKAQAKRDRKAAKRLKDLNHE